ncbi:hypothetical protein QC762_204955 [Podospora pseudocomata]|uniref:Peptidase A1 domain-containing protein n=1 Tax=Podospora pseudocomata TaxID=2093779 RepID=A0ABR0GLB0_9PEZI|nr:hypothetical protein QC762_204955 [Podospora pseudocomata]
MNSIYYRMPNAKGFELENTGAGLRGSCKIYYYSVSSKHHRHPKPCRQALFTTGTQPYPGVLTGYPIRTLPDYVLPNTPKTGLEMTWGLLARFLGGEEEQPRRPSSREELVKTPIVLKGLQFYALFCDFEEGEGVLAFDTG